MLLQRLLVSGRSIARIRNDRCTIVHRTHAFGVCPILHQMCCMPNAGVRTAPPEDRTANHNTIAQHSPWGAPPVRSMQ